MDIVDKIVLEAVQAYNDPFFFKVFAACNALALLCWIATLLTNNCSHVDRLWSIVPTVYAWSFVYAAVPKSVGGLSDLLDTKNSNLLRMVLMSFVMTLWSVRLTYNFFRKGGYSLSEEDYRWNYVRAFFNYPQSKFLFHLFNLVFTSFLQNWLLFGLATPIWYIKASKTAQREPFNALDAALVGLFLLFLLVEVVADQQQWNFQTKKHLWLKNPKGAKYSAAQIESFKRGFIVTGLFKYSRHPNFFAEMLLWWIIYGFTLSSQLSALTGTGISAASLVNYTVLATFVLTCLFQGSTALTEKISAGKYKEYVNYQKHVSRLIPFFSSYEPSNDKRN